MVGKDYRVTCNPHDQKSSCKVRNRNKDFPWYTSFENQNLYVYALNQLRNWADSQAVDMEGYAHSCYDLPMTYSQSGHRKYGRFSLAYIFVGIQIHVSVNNRDIHIREGADAAVLECWCSNLIKRVSRFSSYQVRTLKILWWLLHQQNGKTQKRPNLPHPVPPSICCQKRLCQWIS